MSYKTQISRHAGFTMVEILVAMIIMAVGLLGLAGLQSRALQAEMESYQRTQAYVLLDDMANRLNANRAAARCYELATHGADWVGVGNANAYSCTDWGTASDQAVAIADVTAWERLLQGQAETKDGENVGAMANARGCISVDATGGLFTISIAWEGIGRTVAPADTCAQDAFSDGLRRRVVSTTIRIANLT